MARGRSIDKDTVAEMARLRGEGLSLKQIAAIVGVDPRRVSEHLVIQGIRIKSKLISSEELQRKRDEGMFLREISKLYNISISVIKERTKPPTTPIKRRYNPKQASEEEREAIRQLRLTNLSCSEISKKTGRSLSLVKEICVGIKIERKSLKTQTMLLGAENREKILPLRAEGKSIEKIASELSLAVSTVKKHLRRANMSSFDPRPSIKPAAPKTDQVKKAFIHTAIGIAIGAKTRVSVPDHVRRMRDSLMLSRGFTEAEAMSQAMNFYARGKVTAADDDYQPRKLVIRRRQ
jgi:DNA-directed RNA polymerase specialized sigma24 family protein